MRAVDKDGNRDVSGRTMLQHWQDASAALNIGQALAEDGFSVLRELAAMDPFNNLGFGKECVLCEAEYRFDRPEQDHLETCLWLRAQVFKVPV